MRANITYHRGKSYTVGSVRFQGNRTTPVTDEAVIKRCLNTSGFSVQMLSETKPMRKVRAVVESTPEKSAEEKPDQE